MEMEDEQTIKMRLRIGSASIRPRRSQVGMGDLFLSVSVFVILLVAVVLIYNNYNENFVSRQEYNLMQTYAFQATNLMVKSGGIPAGWEADPDSARLIGFAYNSNNERNLSPQKVESFLNISYDRSKELLGSGYDFYLRIADIQGNILAEKGMNSTGYLSAAIERRVLYDGDEAVLSLAFWR
ncbi:MAG TPA: hypothetical protein VJC00_02605 [Candidatus Nanoarchaeia archaeon]|nr:hypothetical protein [Candidatus Nanoarchaeia archaeon]